MRITLLLLFFSAFFISAKAQLANTHWKGAIHTDETLDVVFQFGSDTLKVVNTGDAATIEVLTYTIKDKLITLQKVSGQSDCTADVIGQYKYTIDNNTITFTLMNDACEQRAAILNNSKWTKEG